MTSSSGVDKITKNRGCALVISRSQKTIDSIKETLTPEEFFTLVSNNEEQALNLILSKLITYVLIDADLAAASSNEFIGNLRKHIGDRYIPIIILVSPEDEELFSYCITEKCDDFLIKPFTSAALMARIFSLEKMREISKLYKSSINEQLVAKKILTSALNERTTQLEEIKILSKSKGVLSGDLFITARHPDGSLNILLADFTGHGLPAAIGALPVADIFSVMTTKGFDPDRILDSINRKLFTLLPTSMFMACIVLNITNDLKHVSIWNGGMPDIYIREKKTGHIHHKIKSTHLPLGINDTILNSFDLIKIDLTPGDELILYTDGLTEALNADGDMFGYQRLDQCLENNRINESIFTVIVDEFNLFCADVIPMDDITLACIPCNSSLMNADDTIVTKNMELESSGDHGWCWYMELGGSCLQEINPIPIVLSEINKITGHSASTDKLSTVMSLLYNNTLKNNALTLADSNSSEITFSNNLINNKIYDICIRIGIKKIEHNGEPALFVLMEDSCKVVDHDELMNSLNNIKEYDNDSLNETVPLVYALNNSSSYQQGMGNRLEAIICQRL